MNGNTGDNRRKGTGFTNISRILQANTGNRLSSTLQGGISQQAGQVRSGLQEQGRTFQEQAQAGRLGTEQDVEAREGTLKRFEQPSGGQFQEVSPGEQEAFKRFRRGTYAGPTELDQSKLQQTRGKAQETQQLGQLTQTGEGRGQLLQRFVGDKQYGAGQQRLDQLLLGQQGVDKLRQARRETLGLPSEIREEEQRAQQLGQQFQSEAQKFGETTRQRLGEMSRQREQELTDQADSMRSKAEQDWDNILEKTKKEELGEAEMAALGMSPEEQARFKFLQELSGQKYASKANITGTQAQYRSMQDPLRSVFGKEAMQKYEEDLQKLRETELDVAKQRAFGLGEREYRLEDGKYVAYDPHSLMGQKWTERREITPEEYQQALSSYISKESMPNFNIDPRGREVRTQPDLSALAIQKYQLAKMRGDEQGMSDATKDYMANKKYVTEFGIGAPSTGLEGRQVTGGIDLDENLLKYFQDKGMATGSAGYEELLKGLGLTSGSISGFEYSQRPDVEFERYLQKYDPASITRETAASGEQLAKLNALSRLSGQEEIYDPTLAGTAQTGVKLDQRMWQDALDQLVGSGEVKLNELGQFQPTTPRAESLIRRYADAAGGVGMLTPIGIGTQMLGVENPLTSIAGGVGELVGGMETASGGNLSRFLLPGGGLSLTDMDKLAKSFTRGATSAVSDAWGGIKKLFCFLEGTNITLEDGTTKPIEAIIPGDVVALGGEVLSNDMGVSSEIYQIGQLKVTGGHAIFLGIDGWDRAENIPNAEKYTGTFKIYYIVTEDHLLYAENTIVADCHETDWGELYDDETSLTILNNDYVRNSMLMFLLEDN